VADGWKRRGGALILLGVLTWCAVSAAWAQTTSGAIVTPMQTPMTAQKPSPVVIELFSSQACTYCPAADAYMADLLKQEGVIGLSCHIDYFDVQHGSLSKKFCTARQKDYAEKMKLKSVYTPQMVINGHMDAIGYEPGKVSIAVLRARSEKMAEIAIRPLNDGAYAYAVPPWVENTGGITLWVAMFDKPHTLTVAEGGNRGKKLTYHNIVNALTDIGEWDGTPNEKTIMPVMNAGAAGFAVLAQENATGKIVAAGVFNRP